MLLSWGLSGERFSPFAFDHLARHQEQMTCLTPLLGAHERGQPGDVLLVVRLELLQEIDLARVEGASALALGDDLPELIDVDEVDSGQLVRVS